MRTVSVSHEAAVAEFDKAAMDIENHRLSLHCLTSPACQLARNLASESGHDIPSMSATERMVSAEDYIEAALSKATRRAYAGDVHHFLSRGGSIPATPEQIMAYLADAAQSLAVATIERRLIAIHKAHTDQALPSPVMHPLVKKTMQGIRRTVGTRQRQVRAVVKDDLLAMLVMVDQQKPLKAARDRALLLFGFAGAFRRSELVSLRCEDLTDHANGIEVLLRHSKTDQEKAGRTVFIPYAHGSRCPVKALRDWQNLTGISSGWLFRSVNRHDQVSNTPLTPQSVALVVKAAVARMGGDPSVVAGHSLRAGYVTTAVISGHQPHQIKEQTGHRSDATLARYIRPVVRRKIPSLL
jgi:integrase